MNRLIGAVMLIMGTCIGAGMLAMPVATAQNGLIVSSGIIVVCWALMTLGSLFVLEASQICPPGSNLISMARKTLGRPGEIITWLTCLLLLYALLSAYIAAGSQITASGLKDLNFSNMTSSVIFTVVMGSIVFAGIYWVDGSNRLLMSLKFISLFTLMALITPSTHFKSAHLFNLTNSGMALTVIITSFGFATIIPSLKTYLNDDIKQLRKAILIGSIIPLVLYLIWNSLIHTILSTESLVAMEATGNASSQLAQALIATTHSPLITIFADLFTSICVLTSFLGVALSLSDFLADGLNIAKTTKVKRLLNTAITLGPSLLLVILSPKIFISALSYAGECCVILLMLIPALMVWKKRQQHRDVKGYQVAIAPFLLMLYIAFAGLIVILSFALTNSS